MTKVNVNNWKRGVCVGGEEFNSSDVCLSSFWTKPRLITSHLLSTNALLSRGSYVVTWLMTNKRSGFRGSRAWTLDPSTNQRWAVKRCCVARHRLTLSPYLASQNPRGGEWATERLATGSERRPKNKKPKQKNTVSGLDIFWRLKQEIKCRPKNALRHFTSCLGCWKESFFGWEFRLSARVSARASLPG